LRARRLADVPGFGIDKVAAAAGSDPEVLRMENLDTDLPPPPGVVDATRRAVGEIEYNSWLPFSGRHDLKEAVADHVEARSGLRYDPLSEIVITTADGDGLLDALLATTDPGDEVVLTDPTYAGMINRVRLAGGVPRFAECGPVDGEWRLDIDSLRAAVTDKTSALFLQNATFPTGMVFTQEEWSAIADLVVERLLHLIYWGFMESVLFDGPPSASSGFHARDARPHHHDRLGVDRVPNDRLAGWLGRGRPRDGRCRWYRAHIQRTGGEWVRSSWSHRGAEIAAR